MPDTISGKGTFKWVEINSLNVIDELTQGFFYGKSGN